MSVEISKLKYKEEKNEEYIKEHTRHIDPVKKSSICAIGVAGG